MAEIIQLLLLVVIAGLGLGVVVLARLSGVRPRRVGYVAVPEGASAAEAPEWRSPLAEVYPQPEPELS